MITSHRLYAWTLFPGYSNSDRYEQDSDFSLEEEQFLGAWIAQCSQIKKHIYFFQDLHKDRKEILVKAFIQAMYDLRYNAEHYHCEPLIFNITLQRFGLYLKHLFSEKMLKFVSEFIHYYSFEKSEMDLERSMIMDGKEREYHLFYIALTRDYTSVTERCIPNIVDVIRKSIYEAQIANEEKEMFLYLDGKEQIICFLNLAETVMQHDYNKFIDVSTNYNTSMRHTVICGLYDDIRRDLSSHVKSELEKILVKEYGYNVPPKRVKRKRPLVQPPAPSGKLTPKPYKPVDWGKYNS